MSLRRFSKLRFYFLCNFSNLRSPLPRYATPVTTEDTTHDPSPTRNCAYVTPAGWKGPCIQPSRWRRPTYIPTIFLVL